MMELRFMRVKISCLVIVKMEAREQLMESLYGTRKNY